MKWYEYPYPHRSCKVEIGEDGVLPLPDAVLESHGLGEGDLLALDVEVFRDMVEGFVKFQIPRDEAVRLASIEIRTYRGLLGFREFCRDDETFWPFVAQFLSLPLAAVGPEGKVSIPLEVYEMRRGERMHISRSGEHQFLLGRCDR